MFTIKSVTNIARQIDITFHVSNYSNTIHLTGMPARDECALKSSTVEPRYNEVLGTITITLLYQVSHYIRVKKTRKYKELGPAKLPCCKRVLLYPTSL